MTISQNAIRELAPNIYKFLDATHWGEQFNCYLVLDDESAILIDAPPWSNNNRDAVAALGSVESLMLTHAPASGDGPKWKQYAGVKMCMNELDIGNKWLSGEPSHMFAGDHQISTHLRALHTPGHSPGHTMYFDDRNGGTLFSGDGILLKQGEFKCELDARAVEKISAIRAERILPYHHELIMRNGSTRLRAYLSERES